MVNRFSELTIGAEILLLIVMEGFVLVALGMAIIRAVIFYRKKLKGYIDAEEKEKQKARDSN